MKLAIAMRKHAVQKITATIVVSLCAVVYMTAVFYVSFTLVF